MLFFVVNLQPYEELDQKSSPLLVWGPWGPHLLAFHFYPLHSPFQFLHADPLLLQSPFQSFLLKHFQSPSLDFHFSFFSLGSGLQAPSSPPASSISGSHWAGVRTSPTMDRWTWLWGPGDMCSWSGHNSLSLTFAYYVWFTKLPISCSLLRGQSTVLSPYITPRSLPVLNMEVAMRFTPSEVAKVVYQCWEEVPATLEAGEATVCLAIHKSSLDQLGESPSRPSPSPPRSP